MAGPELLKMQYRFSTEGIFKLVLYIKALGDFVENYSNLGRIH